MITAITIWLIGALFLFGKLFGNEKDEMSASDWVVKVFIGLCLLVLCLLIWPFWLGFSFTEIFKKD